MKIFDVSADNYKVSTRKKRNWSKNSCILKFIFDNLLLTFDEIVNKFNQLIFSLFPWLSRVLWIDSILFFSRRNLIIIWGIVELLHHWRVHSLKVLTILSLMKFWKFGFNVKIDENSTLFVLSKTSSAIQIHIIGHDWLIFY